ncbi:MAG TPA: DegT/DnrJ/EryC1/StrS family aminotransferase [Gemmatimonadaceae bacterium]|nr:DegT/DnrJ/EryC1/StrS family aminotransferase [Gemmatimonadaceae bacterium]
MPLAALRQARGGDRALASLADLVRERWAADAVGLLDSGTHALTVALQVAARFAPVGRTVALPAYTCYDVATAAVASGLRITFYDLDPGTLAPDLDSLDQALAAGADVVVVAPLFGVPVTWDAIRTRVERAGGVLVEDAAQGHGSSWHGLPAGSHAPLSVLSFGRGKGWTGGGGGAILARGVAVRHFDFARDVPHNRSAGTGAWARAAALALFAHPELFAIPAAVPWLHLGETRYHEPTPTRGMVAAAAGMLLATWEAAQHEAEGRRLSAARYLAELTATPAVRPVLVDANGVGGYLRFPLFTARGMEGFASPERARRLGITPGYPAPLPQLGAVLTSLAEPSRSRRFPGAEALSRQLVTMPTHSFVRPEEQREILRLVHGYQL